MSKTRQREFPPVVFENAPSEAMILEAIRIAQGVAGKEESDRSKTHSEQKGGDEQGE